MSENGNEPKDENKYKIELHSITNDNTVYNPFSPNQIQNNSNNSHNEIQEIHRPYLNEIQNQGPKQTNLNNNDNISNNNNSNIQEKKESNNKSNYELALEYENFLRQEIEQTTPLISEQLEIKILLNEYKDNLEYSDSVKKISEKYKYIRKVRRDGNCFYRAYIYRLFEMICMKNDKILYEKVLKKIEESKEITKKNGYDWIVVEDFYNTFYSEFCNCFNCVTNSGISVRDYLDNLFSDKDKGQYLIYFIRFCIASYLKENYLIYEVYIEDEFNNWIQKEVEAIDHEADQIQIMACVNYFDIGVKIEYLNPHKSEEMKFPEDKKDDEIFINVLFTPGHYDILYP